MCLLWIYSFFAAASHRSSDIGIQKVNKFFEHFSLMDSKQRFGFYFKFWVVQVEQAHKSELQQKKKKTAIEFVSMKLNIYWIKVQ